MACTRTLPLHSDSSVRPTTRDPAHTLQTQSRCSIVALTPYSSPRLPRPPPYEKQQKLNYSKLTTETAFFTNAEGEKKTHHITCLPPLPSLPSLPPLLPLFSFDWIAVPNEGSLIHLSCGVESRQRSSPSQQNDSFFYYCDERVK